MVLKRSEMSEFSPTDVTPSLGWPLPSLRLMNTFYVSNIGLGSQTRKREESGVLDFGVKAQFVHAVVLLVERRRCL